MATAAGAPEQAQQATVYDTLRALIAVEETQRQQAGAIDSTLPAPQEVAAWRQEIAERRISTGTLRRLTAAVPELTTVPSQELNALQSVLLAEAFAVEAHRLRAFRWGRYPAPSGSALAGAAFLTVWLDSAASGERAVVAVDSTGRLFRP